MASIETGYTSKVIFTLGVINTDPYKFPELEKSMEWHEVVHTLGHSNEIHCFISPQQLSEDAGRR